MLWWLLRLIPPRPRRLDFPPTRFLLEIAPREETPARTPWWLTLMRLTLAALVIVAAAGPLWHPPLVTTKTSAPVAILIDDSWPAAATWDARLRTADDIIARAEDATPRRGAHSTIRRRARHFVGDRGFGARAAAPDAADAVHVRPRRRRCPRCRGSWPRRRTSSWSGCPTASISAAAPSFVKSLAQAVGRHPLTVVAGGIPGARALTAADNAAGALSVKVLRAAAGAAETGTVRAFDLKGLPLGEAAFAFKAADREADARFDLPVELRNDIARLEISGERSAGAVQLLDKRWRRRTVGIVSGAIADMAEPLLSSSYYVQRALEPFADVRLTQGQSPAEAVDAFSRSKSADADPDRRRQCRRRP